MSTYLCLLQAVSAVFQRSPEADDGARTRDLRLGKPTLYQLSYVRAAAILSFGRRARGAIIDEVLFGGRVVADGLFGHVGRSSEI
jgi:hypothetical protein